MPFKYEKFTSKIDSLCLFISKNPFDVIAVSEIWLKPSTTNAEIDIPNYSITRNDRTDKTGGGRHFMFVMVYRFAHAGICKAVTLRPVGLKSYHRQPIKSCGLALKLQ